MDDDDDGDDDCSLIAMKDCHIVSGMFDAKCAKVKLNMPCFYSINIRPTLHHYNAYEKSVQHSIVTIFRIITPHSATPPATIPASLARLRTAPATLRG